MKQSREHSKRWVGAIRSLQKHHEGMIRKSGRVTGRGQRRRGSQMIVKTSRENESNKGFCFAKMFSSRCGPSQAGANAILIANATKLKSECMEIYT